MKTIVIPDLHNNVYWVEQFLADNPSDEVVLLGDYFDNFSDNASTARLTAHWLKMSLTKANRMHLWGNHDLPYAFFGVDYLYCPGYTDYKRYAINDVLDDEDWSKLTLAYSTQGWFLSHAGVHPHLFGRPLVDADITVPSILETCQDALDCARRGIYHKAFYQGSRMDEPGPGGITWLHWGDFMPIEGMNQIVGHTNGKVVRYNNIADKSCNLCIDTAGRHACIITDGKAEVVNVQKYHKR